MRSSLTGLVLCALSFYPVSGMSETTPANAQPLVQRACTDKDILGTFSLANLVEIPESELTTNLRRFPYHYLSIRPNHVFAQLQSRNPIDGLRLDKMFAELIKQSNLNKSQSHYILGEEGRLELYIGNQMFYTGYCTARLVSGAGYQKKRLNPAIQENAGHCQDYGSISVLVLIGIT